MSVVDLKALMKERGLRGYSVLRKAELIAFLRDNLQLHTRPPPIPAPRPIPTPRPPPRLIPAPRPHPRLIPTPRPPPRLIPTPRLTPALRPPPRLIPPPRPPPRPASPPRPYQLRPKRGKETFIEPPMEQRESLSTSPKQIKWMKKKLDKLNKKIRHSKKKNDVLIHKRNSLRRAIEDLKQGTRQPTIEHRFIECEQAFGRAYRSYRIEGE